MKENVKKGWGFSFLSSPNYFSWSTKVSLNGRTSTSNHAKAVPWAFQPQSFPCRCLVPSRSQWPKDTKGLKKSPSDFPRSFRITHRSVTQTSEGKLIRSIPGLWTRWLFPWWSSFSSSSPSSSALSFLLRPFSSVSFRIRLFSSLEHGLNRWMEPKNLEVDTRRLRILSSTLWRPIDGDDGDWKKKERTTLDVDRRPLWTHVVKGFDRSFSLQCRSTHSCLDCPHTVLCSS